MKNITQLYQYFDDLVSQECSNDELFASSYLRGFISLAASQFGDDSQLLTKALAEDVDDKLHAARTELSPEDRTVVNQYWQNLQQYFVHS
ncbi:YfcL family protein [Thalassotalea sp. G2M2-11]|uniref:YfcL family protein n=1 Tax=Thalassotalea sp. G2M2-11 TaxID=2787627 RepID=UPI0019CF54AA|nr:YfcL family protein [Thalassotalea sp. G2M2-11]